MKITFNFLFSSWEVSGPLNQNKSINFGALVVPMVESTRSKASSDRLEDAIAKLTSHHLSLTETVHTMTLKLDELIQKLAQPEASSPSPSASNSTPPMPTSTPHSLRLDVPRFDGTEPLGWIFKINQFFDYHDVILPPKDIG